MSIAIKFENVSKQFRLGEVGTGTISRDIERAWARLRGKPDPFAKIGVSNNREVSGGEYVWALKDIDFDVKQGEILGIIGRNGAGKSTLLKLLSRVTAPTTGCIKAKGRIASLLEVGTGFHPELTGRENIYLNGAILGMRRHEISLKLEDIVEFSGCAKYIDTPVKRYSSGMTVRLGFAVAAHLNCEILVVDEVLAVGDVEFQKKCIGKMQEVSENAGKTVLFVSHNMSSIERLCQQGVLMCNGSVVDVAPIRDVVERYLSSSSGENSQFSLSMNNNRSGSGEARLRSVSIIGSNNSSVTAVRCGECLRLRFVVENVTNRTIAGVSIGYSLTTSRGELLVVTYSDYEGVTFTLSPGLNQIDVETNKLNLSEGIYQLGCRITSNLNELDWPRWNVLEVSVSGGDFGGSSVNPHSGRGLLLIENQWRNT